MLLMDRAATEHDDLKEAAKEAPGCVCDAKGGAVKPLGGHDLEGAKELKILEVATCTNEAAWMSREARGAFVKPGDHDFKEAAKSPPALIKLCGSIREVATCTSETARMRL
ncbi:unnamed protein product [Closterium sp. Yama58-4]|nr:unnamed protein product [Closterium sp. Yama58-4]